MVQTSVINTKIKGNKGENVACDFLVGQGFLILDRNYQKKWGKLDIIAKKDGIVHFFEVKSVSFDLRDKISNAHSPEENVHALKVRKIRRMIETYLGFTGRGLDAEFQFHILCVYLNTADGKNDKSEIKWIKNVIL